MQTKIFKNLTDDICFKHLFKEERFLSDFLNSFFDYIGVKKRVVGLKVTTEMEMHGTKRNKKVFYGDKVNLYEMWTKNTRSIILPSIFLN